MKLINSILVICLLLASASCNGNTSKTNLSNNTEEHSNNSQTSDDLKKYEVAYFASGCFWCVEAIFEDIIGVKEVISGYAGGKELNPTYEQVGRGNTTHAEAVKIYYDASKVSFETLVLVFFASHDPTTLNKQGPDVGAQYRSIAFYTSIEEKKIIEDYIAKLKYEKKYDSAIVTQVEKLTKFYDAEDYHQDYEKLHPNNPYIRNISIPRYNRFKAKHPELLKKNTH